MDNYQIDFYQDDPDVLAKSRFKHAGKDYDVTIITAAPGGCTNKYLPEIFQTSESDITVAFDGEYFEQQINAAVAQAQEELDEIQNTTDYPNHIGSAAASVMSMYLNRAMISVKKHLRLQDMNPLDFFWAEDES
tara:strand:- start:998 stop:1399 length:402 start_codon:yes stop_codon:yes gene_type:complete